MSIRINKKKNMQQLKEKEIKTEINKQIKTILVDSESYELSV